MLAVNNVAGYVREDVQRWREEKGEDERGRSGWDVAGKKFLVTLTVIRTIMSAHVLRQKTFFPNSNKSYFPNLPRSRPKVALKLFQKLITRN
jgi:hypothetical protein